ncbi:hypothetical protein [Treponema sp.]|uniref:hypothetical protein n=1 Tax=Treponema sp. TaxID=166 RepID=UPI00298E9848|nr:hypothetical protein [Treponema sp.]MCR5614079.1 hypothetical protein [Treponema sp.]
MSKKFSITKTIPITIIILLAAATLFTGCFTILNAMARYETEERTVFVVRNNNQYHSADCPEIKDKRKTGMPIKEAIEKGYTRCPICDPD